MNRAMKDIHLEGAEPSPNVDRLVLSFARVRQREIHAKRRRVVWTRAGMVAAGLLFLIGLFWAGGLPPRSPETRGIAVAPLAGSPVETRTPALEQAVGELRRDIEEIGEMSDLIPAEREAQRQEILERVRACLADIEELEERLGMNRTSDRYEPIQRKELNV